MPLSPNYIDFAAELLAGLAPLAVKKMFGGAQVAKNGVAFAILDDDTCFIKADLAFGAELKAQGSRPWRYSLAKDGTVRDIGYWSLPETALDDPDEAAALARRALQAVKAAAAAKALKTSAKSKPAARTNSAAKAKPARAKPKAKASSRKSASQKKAR